MINRIYILPLNYYHVLIILQNNSNLQAFHGTWVDWAIMLYFHRSLKNYTPFLSKKRGECQRRCSKTSHVNNCLLFCNKCCNKCLCVPPGTYGNKECCPCYNNWKTKEGGPKCP
ncbi:hypothetical protein Pfo_006548 [Paulownia fortunei]|nr:hypothetical protein Pfo_006548 [Paulownia fortunei]